MLCRQPFTAATVSKPTVNYHCLWGWMYRALGETTPPDAKPSLDVDKPGRWLRSLNRRELEIASRLVGVSAVPIPAQSAPANDLECPCGSGKRAEHCHGAPA
jgi:hypothetical protein